MRLLPAALRSVIDIGARDGYLSKALARHADMVTALDLQLPQIDDPKVTCARGDATALQFADAAFDLVFCSEVLEHIPSPALERACRELERVANRYLLIGVPYRQDIRHGRTTCQSCGTRNPPWAHVNSFDEDRLHRLFPGCVIEKISYVGLGEPGTNALSVWLLDRAGNPYGTYAQEEGCIHCGDKLRMPPPRTPLQKLLTRLAHVLRRAQLSFAPRRANWVHVLYRKE